ncbi:uridine kinase [Paenibacillus glucanolyticus]|uniref:Uridine kinase n=1 Tax=Paenibacillus glucanolyticus TaxID=59843 RepID=A0A163E2Z0_9BACL|nr:AAA family ATPase [Paenibacillus glucanolyticus]KZS43570.1 uridine kinase [Paenibacillus glucanolyticus]
MEQSRCLTIGIGGGSGSGKTTLSLKLKEKLSEYRVALFHMDKYYKAVRPMAKAPFTNRVFEDFNHPDAVHIQRLTEDYEQAVRSGEYDVILIEGFLLYQFEGLRDSLDLKLFIDCPADERMLRRSQWFIDKGHSEESVLQEYLQLVRYRHDEYVEPTRWYADLVVNNSLMGNVRGCTVVADWIHARLQDNGNKLD